MSHTEDMKATLDEYGTRMTLEHDREEAIWIGRRIGFEQGWQEGFEKGMKEGMKEKSLEGFKIYSPINLL